MSLVRLSTNENGSSATCDNKPSIWTFNTLQALMSSKFQVQFLYCLILHNCPIRIKYSFETMFWLAVIFSTSIYTKVLWQQGLIYGIIHWSVNQMIKYIPNNINIKGCWPLVPRHQGYIVRLNLWNYCKLEGQGSLYHS